MRSVCRCSLPVWRRSFLKKGTPHDLFWPALDPPLGGSGRKTTTLVRDHEYFIPTKFHQNPSSGSGEEVENVKSLRTDGRTTDGRTDDGRCAMTIAHSSLRLRWAKKKKGEKTEGLNCSCPLFLLQKYGVNRLSRQLFTFNFIFGREWFFCNWEPLYTTTHMTQWFLSG